MKIKKILSKIHKMEYWNCINQEIFSDFKLKRLFFKNILFRKLFIKNINKNIDLYCIYSKFNLRVIVSVNRSNNVIEFFTNLQFYLDYSTSGFKKKSFDNYIILYGRNSKLSDKDFEFKFIDEYIIKMCRIFNIKLVKKIEIYVLERSFFKKIFHSNGVTGFFDEIKSKIYVDDINLYVTHEIIHAILNNYNHKLNIFINEGIAEAFKKPLNADHINIDTNISFSDIYFNNINELTVKKYFLAGMFFRYIYCIYGLDKLLAVIDVNENDISLFKNKLVLILEDIFFERNFNLWLLNLNFNNIDWFFLEGDL